MGRNMKILTYSNNVIANNEKERNKQTSCFTEKKIHRVLSWSIPIDGSRLFCFLNASIFSLDMPLAKAPSDLSRCLHKVLNGRGSLSFTMISHGQKNTPPKIQTLLTLLSIYKPNDVALSCGPTFRFLVANSIHICSSSKLYSAYQIWRDFLYFFFLWGFLPC